MSSQSIPIPPLIYGDNTYLDLYASTLKGKNAEITNLTVSNLEIDDIEVDFTNLIATNITTTNINATNANITNITTSSLTLTDLATTNITSTNFLTVNATATNATITNVNATNLTSSDLEFSNLSLTNLSTTNLTSTDAILTNLTATNAEITNLTTSNLTILNSTTIDSNLLVTGFIQENGKFILNDTFVAYGDGYTSGVGSESGTSWPAMLATLSGKTAINRGVDQTTITRLTNQNGTSYMDDIITDAAYNDYSFIIAYGFDDLRNTNALFADSALYQWYLVYLNAVVSMATKQENIYDARDSWTTTGAWATNPYYDFGIYSTTNGGTASKTITGRYYMFSFTTESGTDPLSWAMRLDGTQVNRLLYTYRAPDAGTFYSICAIVDAQTSASRTVLVSNDSGGTTNQYFNYCCAWNSASDFRPVLCCSVPMFNYDYTGSSPWNAGSITRNYVYNYLIQMAVDSCQQVELPVHYHQDSNIACFNSTNVYWSDGSYYQRASGINSRL